MKCAEYSEKEIVIFNGLIELIKKGANPYSIKVSDIALAANIGKGTIYDYFTSKEEAISKSILFSINNEIETGFLRIKSKTGFRRKFYEILTIIEESMDNNLSTFKMLSSAGGIHEFYEHLVDERYSILNCLKIIDSIVRHLLEIGHKEGLINTKESKYYQTMVVRGVISGFSGYISHKEIYTNTTTEEAKEAAYKMLLKALN